MGSQKPLKTLQTTRRSLLKGLAALPFGLGFGRMVNASTEKLSVSLRGQIDAHVPMLQGFTDATTTMVNVLGSRGWRFEILTGSPGRIVSIVPKALGRTSKVLYQIRFDSLSLLTNTEFVIYNKAGTLLDVRALKGLDLRQPSPRIALMSCTDFRNVDHKMDLWSKLQQNGAQMILFVGDAVYASTRLQNRMGKPELPADALERYIETWETIGLYNMDPLVPTLAVWDDHDYGWNNGDENHPHRAQMTRMFRTFYPLPEAHPSLVPGPGVSFRFTAFGIDFHMMDSRSFYRRDLTQWGDEQEKWFYSGFTQSHRPAWVLNGTQFFNYFSLAESIERLSPRTFQLIKDLLSTTKKPVCLVSGDVHYSQVQALPSSYFGYDCFEITSSAMQSSSPGEILKRGIKKGQLLYEASSNFLLVNPRVSGTKMQLAVACVTKNGIEVLKKALSISS